MNKLKRGLADKISQASFCHSDEEKGHRACTNGHLTTADQSEIRKAYLVSAARYLKFVFTKWNTYIKSGKNQ